jgi:hypothetical protein
MKIGMFSYGGFIFILHLYLFVDYTKIWTWCQWQYGVSDNSFSATLLALADNWYIGWSRKRGGTNRILDSRGGSGILAQRSIHIRYVQQRKGKHGMIEP